MEQLAFEGSSGGAVGLWDDDADWREAETTMDALRARFGPGSVTSASLLGGSTKRISRGDRDTNGAAQRGASATDAS
jgi:DNA polymerase-4